MRQLTRCLGDILLFRGLPSQPSIFHLRGRKGGGGKVHSFETIRSLLMRKINLSALLSNVLRYSEQIFEERASRLAKKMTHPTIRYLLIGPPPVRFASRTRLKHAAIPQQSPDDVDDFMQHGRARLCPTAHDDSHHIDHAVLLSLFFPSPKVAKTVEIIVYRLYYVTEQPHIPWISSGLESWPVALHGHWQFLPYTSSRGSRLLIPDQHGSERFCAYTVENSEWRRRV